MLCVLSVLALNNLSFYFAYVHTQSWADAFRSSPSLVGVVYVYDDLRKRGLEFPMTDLDAMSPIHTPNRVRLLPKITLPKLMSPKLMSKSTRSYNFPCLQSIPENGGPEVSPNVTCTRQSPPQTPASVPSQNSSPPVQPGEGPLSISPQQVGMLKLSKV